MKAFFDTNVLVYLFDGSTPAKQHKARELLTRHTVAGETVLSTQVLQEFYVAVTRKLATPLEPQAAYQAVKEGWRCCLQCESIFLLSCRRSR